MTDPKKWARSCLGKKRYSSAGLADSVAKKCTRDRGKPIRAYYCKECCGHHLTSQPLGTSSPPPSPTK